MFPLVIMLLVSIIEFSRIWNVQATLSDGARISARYVAVHLNDADAEAQAKTAIEKIPGLFNWSEVDVDIDPACGSGESGIVTSTLTTTPGSITGWFSTVLGEPIELKAVGVTPCGG